jgi:hypothetical protein
MASHFGPRPSDKEVIEAIRYHFPLQVQRIMLGTQLLSIGEALDLLIHVELMEVQDAFHKPTNNTATQDTNSSRQGPSRNNQDRNKV